MDIALSIIVTVLLTLANGYFSKSEMAISTARQVLLEHDANEGDNRAKLALQLAENPTEALATIQVAITLLGFFSSAFAATTLSNPLGDWFVTLGMDASGAYVLATILITLVVSYFSIVVGELVPKRIAMADAEKVAKQVAGPLKGFSKAFKPLVALTSASANGLARLMHVKGTEDRQEVSEDEIKYMVTDSEELSDQEKSMIHDVIDMGDTIAREVMVPRVDMTCVEDNATLSDVLAIMHKTGYSRIPIYHGSVDRIVGIAHIKDLLTPIIDDHDGNKRISNYMREADYVPDTKDIIPLLSEMQSSHDQMVIVVDEYGGTAGIITVEDIVEEIVGEIEDEFDPDNKYLTQLSDREWLVDGRFSIDDARELGWPIEDSEAYETIAGFVLELADKVPHTGDVFEVKGYKFKVQSMRGRRLAMLRVTAPKPAPAKDADEVTSGESGEEESAAPTNANNKGAGSVDQGRKASRQECRALRRAKDPAEDDETRSTNDAE